MRFSQVDVFSTDPFGGNPLAVVHDADDWPDDQLAAFARWTNLSETTFLLRPIDSAADYRVRIFTVEGELPFAGHPTLGSCAAYLAALPEEQRRPPEVIQECGAGLVRVRVTDNEFAFLAPPLLRSGPVAAAELAQAAQSLGLTPDQIVGANWVDNGPGWLGILLRSAADVLAATPTAGGRIGLIGPHPQGGPADYEVRAIFGGFEDPATGSLNAGLAQWLIGTAQAPANYTVAQGTVIRRTGRVGISSDTDGIWVSGTATVRIIGELDR